MDHPIRGTLRSADADQARLGWRIIVAALAIGLGLAGLAALRPETWWARSGLDADPGYFVRKVNVDYPLCAHWPDNDTRPGPPTPEGWLMSQRGVTLAPSDKTDLGILLPRTASIGGVYCGSSASGAERECSLDTCTPPVSTLVMDTVYTSNRALIFALTNKSRAPARFHVWVVWKKG